MRLTRREKLLAFSMGVLIITWGIFSLAVSPVLDRIKTLNRVLPEKQSELEQIRFKADNLIALNAGIESLRSKVSSQDKSFELLPHVESVLKECGLSQNRETFNKQEKDISTDYREIVVEIKLKKLTYRQILDFLIKLKSSKAVTGIKRLHIRKNHTDADFLDSDLEISSLKLLQK